MLRSTRTWLSFAAPCALLASATLAWGDYPCCLPGESYRVWPPSYYMSPSYAPCAPPLAKVTPAPPSGMTQEPPLIPKGNPKDRVPIITEMRSLGSAQAPMPSGAKLKVGFWNKSGRDVAVRVDGGDPMNLPRNHGMTLELQRVFVWQVDQGEQKTERISDESNSFEVDIR